MIDTAFNFDRDRAGWFIRMRWFAVFAVAGCVFLSQYVLKFFPPGVTPYLCLGTGFLLLSNICFAGVKAKIRNPRRFILFQMVSDLCILAYLLHFSGGIENPLFIIFVFHVMIAGILLPGRDAYLIAFITAVLSLSLVAAEYTGIIRHYSLISSSGVVCAGLPYVAGAYLSFALLLCGTAYFITSIMGRLRLVNDRLVRSEKLMVLGQVTGYIAHEVNNPIMIISSKAKLALAMKDAGIPESVRDKLKVIERYSERVGSVVKGLLGFIRPGVMAQETQETDINEVIAEALNIAEHTLRAAGVEADIRKGRNIPCFRGRFYEMVQVFVNMFENAADAMPAGGRLSIITEYTGNSFINVIVSDTGLGVSPPDAKKIFEPLFTTKHDTGGIGLGLSVVRSIVRAHDGDIYMKSALGKGTVFTIKLPAMLKKGVL